MCPYAFWSVSEQSLFSIGSCCIIYLMIDSYILPFTPFPSPHGAPFALCPLPSSPHIYLALTHHLLLIDLMSAQHSLFVSPTSSPQPFLLFLPCLIVKGPAFTMWGFIRSAWTALTLVMRFHYWTKVRDPSSERLSSLLHRITHLDSLSVPTPGPYAVTQHAGAAAAGFAIAWQMVAL